MSMPKQPRTPFFQCHLPIGLQYVHTELPGSSSRTWPGAGLGLWSMVVTRIVKPGGWKSRVIIILHVCVKWEPIKTPWVKTYPLALCALSVHCTLYFILCATTNRKVIKRFHHNFGSKGNRRPGLLFTWWRILIEYAYTVPLLCPTFLCGERCVHALTCWDDVW